MVFRRVGFAVAKPTKLLKMVGFVPLPTLHFYISVLDAGLLLNLLVGTYTVILSSVGERGWDWLLIRLISKL
jgi:hypothetical protein